MREIHRRRLPRRGEHRVRVITDTDGRKYEVVETYRGTYWEILGGGELERCSVCGEYCEDVLDRDGIHRACAPLETAEQRATRIDHIENPC